jgi:ABC-type dipeptide/oligopeptide/nickel transport system ATPase component
MAEIKEQQLTVMIVGRSGSGKSYLAKNLVKDLKRPVRVLNDRSQTSEFDKVDWAGATALQSTCLIVEDLLTIDRRQEAILKTLLNWSNNHSKVTFSNIYKCVSQDVTRKIKKRNQPLLFADQSADFDRPLDTKHGRAQVLTVHAPCDRNVAAV